MPMTQYGAQATIWAIGSNLSNNYIQYFAIGSGSGTAAITNVTLQNETGSRATITGSPNFATARKVTFQGDYNSVQMSGISLREFGLLASGASLTGSVWAREAFSAVTFDGTQELQITYSVDAVPG